MAPVTLQRSSTPSAASSSASNSELGGWPKIQWISLRLSTEVVDRATLTKLSHSLSESFFMVKGAALFLQQGNSPQGQRSLQHPHKHAGDLPQLLQVMINLLRCEDRIKLAVRLESAWTDRVRYMVVVYSSGRQDTEENILLGVDFSSKESKSCTIGMVLRLWSDTKIHLDGDGGFSVSTAGRMHIFKPVSVQAMWSALQVLHKACEVARRHNYFPGGVALIWATYYESCISSEQSCINEWNAMQDLESTRPDSGAAPGLAERSLLERENLNNNSSKRSCPEDLEQDAMFGILNKVKPSCKSCADCMYPAAGGAPEAFRERCEDPSAPAICTQPALLPHLISSPAAHVSSRSRALEKPASGLADAPTFLPPAGSRRPDASGPGAAAAPELPSSISEPSRETSRVLPKSLLLKNSHCDKNTPGMEVVKEELSPKKEPKSAKDRRLLFSNESEKPTTNSYLMQHQESIIQLQKAGLVRKHTKELERLKSLPADSAVAGRDSAPSRLEASIPEESPQPTALQAPGPQLCPAKRQLRRSQTLPPSQRKGPR
ncbi:Protein phosphatase Slingshot-like protein 1 [Sciurus carolinensis]|uniref:Protein phosphatase Slingshot-like protein 1 n=1 Tax=Sciurus carolinensis TaxID=30640 RepID=A0AA41SYK0_SCICA|nr:Protein phosphatase Slingshot-like protein 1 [Sciurus carolinensis]